MDVYHPSLFEVFLRLDSCSQKNKLPDACHHASEYSSLVMREIPITAFARATA